MDKSSFFIKEYVVYGTAIVISLIFLFFLIPMEVPHGQSRLFPYIYCSLILLFSTIHLISIYLSKKIESYQFNKRAYKYIGTCILIFFLYAFGIQFLGYFSLSVLFLLIMMRLLGGSWKLSIIICIVVPGLIYLLFTKLLLLYFPSGILF